MAPARAFADALTDPAAEASIRAPAPEARAMFQIKPMFAVPIVEARLPDCAALNAELEALFVARAAEGAKYANPGPLVKRNDALFESNFRLFDWPHPCIAKLRDFCLGAMYRAIGELNGYDVSTLQRLHMGVESWYHLTRRGGWFGVHNHALHSWSGVYCVRHDGDDPASDSGRLSFIPPNPAAQMYTDMAVANFRPPYALNPLMLRLEPGQLVLFPSWLLHEVLPYEGDTLRITVAFNARFVLQGVPRPDLPLG